MAAEGPDMMSWLRATIEGDKRRAQRATDGPWTAEGMSVRGRSRPYSGDHSVLVIKHTWPQESAHIVLHDPQTEIARCDAELAILDLYERQSAKAGENVMEEDRAWTLWPVVSLLASGYRHREGWQEGWGA